MTSVPTTYQEQMNIMEERLSSLTKKLSILSKPRIQTLAGHIFKRMQGERLKVKCVAQHLDVEFDVFVAQAERFLKQICMESLPCINLSVETDVADVTSLINDSMRHDLPWECMLIENFETVQKALDSQLC